MNRKSCVNREMKGEKDLNEEEQRTEREREREKRRG